MQRELRPLKALRVRRLEDLGRLAAMMSSMGQPVYIIHFEHEGRHIYGIFMIYKDYYNLYGIPIFYYYETERPLDGNYLLVKVDENGETVTASGGVRPGWMHAPIISLERKPDFIEL